MPPSLQDTKSHQGFIKITLVEFGVSVNWWQLFHFNLPTQKVSGKYFRLKRLNNKILPLNFNATTIVNLQCNASVGSANQ